MTEFEMTITLNVGIGSESILIFCQKICENLVPIFFDKINLEVPKTILRNSKINCRYSTLRKSQCLLVCEVSSPFLDS